MENYEAILIKYFTAQNQKHREEAITALKNRDFDTLSHNIYAVRKEFEETVMHRDIETVVKQLQEALKNIKPNQTIPYIKTHIEQEKKQWATNTEIICLVSCFFSIDPIETCTKRACHHTKSCLWKIKHQPNGRDTKRYLEIIETNK